jgi:hypothetical protein
LVAIIAVADDGEAYITGGFDRRTLDLLSNRMSLKDERTLNCGHIQNAEHCLYSSGRLTDERMGRVNGFWEQHPGASCEVRETSWQLSLAGLSPENYFSFIRMKPPLF